MSEILSKSIGKIRGNPTTKEKVFYDDRLKELAANQKTAYDHWRSAETNKERSSIEKSAARARYRGAVASLKKAAWEKRQLLRQK